MLMVIDLRQHQAKDWGGLVRFSVITGSETPCLSLLDPVPD